MRKIKPKAGPVVEPFRLDWRAYFKAFCEAHGEPVEQGGRLIFPDGWTYSATDHKGPEWPPPKNETELGRLLRSYWTIRLDEVKRQEQELRGLVSQVEGLQAGKSGQLLRNNRKQGSDGKWTQEAEAVDLAGMLMRLEWLVQDRLKCETMLAEQEKTWQATASTVA